MSMQLSTFQTFSRDKQDRQSPLNVLVKHYLPTCMYCIVAIFLPSKTTKHSVWFLALFYAKGVLNVDSCVDIAVKLCKYKVLKIFKVTLQGYMFSLRFPSIPLIVYDTTKRYSLLVSTFS